MNGDIIGEILVREGWPKYTDNPNDRGGPTKGGITLKTLSGFIGRTATVEELQALDETTARLVYQTLFIIRPGFVHIKDLNLQDYVVDIGVTSGPVRAIRYLQTLLNLKTDGVFGSLTITAVNGSDGGKLLLRLIAHRCLMMCGDVEANPNQLAEIEGWIRRAVSPLSFIEPNGDESKQQLKDISDAAILVASSAQDHPETITNLKESMLKAVEPINTITL